MSTPPTFPPTVIVVHRKERRSKCTVEPLRAQAGFQFLTYPLAQRPTLAGYVRLGLGGQPLSHADADRGLLVLDATWRLAEKMEAVFADIPIRSLPPWGTAYPRISKLRDDPTEGLATIEAIFAAYHLLGRDTTKLLESYRWRDAFLAINAPHYRLTSEKCEHD
jgi:pre-rRNA-processing protein TSR3